MAKKNNLLNIAILGAGYMGQNHAKVLSSLAGVNLVAICDINREKTGKLSKQYKIREYQDYENLLKSEELDVVSICLPTALHYKAAVEALKKRIPIFLEKPLCATVEEAKKFKKLAKKYKVPVMVGHIERFNPVVNEIKQRLQSGEIGKILKVHTQRFSPPLLSPQDVSVIVDLATHDIDVISYIIGEKPQRIYTEADSKVHKNQDLMSSILRFKSGIMALIEVSWLHPTKIRNLTIVGENGMYQANYLTQELFFYRQNRQLFANNFDPLSTLTRADVVKIAFESKEPLYLELKAFIDAVLNRAKMPVTMDDGLFALDVAEKMARSATNHKIINLND